MSKEFSDYRVVSLQSKGPQRSCYCVEDKSSGRLYVWEAVDYGLLSTDGKKLLLEDIDKLQNLSNQHLLQCVNWVDHKVTETLFLVKEYCGGSVAALIKKCKSTNSFIDESFIWKIIYQLGRAAQAMYTRGPHSIQLDFTSSGVHLDESGNVKLDYWLTFREIEADRSNRGMDSASSRDGSEQRSMKNDTYSLGCLILGITVLQSPLQQQKKQLKMPGHYSEQLQSLIDLMLCPDHGKRPAIEGILYHPFLLSQVVTTSLQQMGLKTEKETVSISPESCINCKELEKKLGAARKREAITKSKELDLKERERFLVQKEKHVTILERLAKEKLSRAEVYLSQVRRRPAGGSLRTDHQENLDSSSYSADTGDTSLLPTTAKLDPTRIIRPPSLAPSTSSRRSVRFETIPEFEEPFKMDNERKTWLQNKKLRYKESKIFRWRGKENLEPQLDVMSKSSVISLPHNTKETSDGLLETFFR